MTLTQEQNEAIQRQGANARALGQSELDNPYFQSENMPPATGDSIELYVAKIEAWKLGWMAENLMLGDNH